MTTPKARAVNRNRVPDYVDACRETWECDQCGKPVPKGASPHIRLAGFSGCMVLRVLYAVAPDGTPCRTAEGLPVITRAEVDWP